MIEVSVFDIELFTWVLWGSIAFDDVEKNYWPLITKSVNVCIILMSYTRGTSAINQCNFLTPKMKNNARHSVSFRGYINK